MDIEVAQLELRYAPLRVMDPGRIARLTTSLAREGQQAPVLVVGEAVLVDGYHRVAALRKLGQDLVQATLLPVQESEALMLTWRMQTGRRQSALEEAWLLRELVEGHGYSQAQLTVAMRRPRSWVSQRLGLVHALPQRAQDAVRAAQVPAQAAMKFLVPMARQDRQAVETLVANLSEPVTVRQMERLYQAWRQADPEGRQRIVAHPGLLLKAEEAVSPVAPDDEGRLAADFEAIAGLCRRARRQVREGVFARANTALLRRSWKEAGLAFASLTEEVDRARPANAGSDPSSSR